MGDMSLAIITSENAPRLAPLARASCGFITSLAWSPDGQRLAVAHGGGLWLWDNGFAAAPSRRLTGHTGPVKDVAFSRDGTVIASASADATVRVWSAAAGDTLQILRGHGGFSTVAFSRSAPLLAAAGGDGQIVFFDMLYQTGSASLQGHIGEITSLAFGGWYRLASGGWDKTVRLWEEGKEQAVIPFADVIRGLSASADRKTLAVACKDGSVSLIDFASGTLIRAWAAHEGGADCAAFSPDGALLVTGGRDNLIKLWDLRVPDEKPVAALDGHSKPVLTVAYHPAGAMIVSGSGDNSVRLWGVSEA